MNNKLIYAAVALIVGLGAGYLIFGDSDESRVSSHDHLEETQSGQMWTCSMHPQIMQPEQGDCPICGMDLIPADASEDGLAPDQFKMTENAVALANVQTIIAGATGNGDVENMITLSGKITENEEANTVQASYFDGRIEHLNLSYVGQEIGEGQLLATIYAPELVAAQQELLTAASLKSAQPELYQAVRNKLKLWKLSEDQINRIENTGKVQENFPIYATVSGTVTELMSTAGDYVKKGQPIAKLSNLNSVWAAFDAYEGQLSKFREGQKVTISTNAYPNETFDATISFIDPVLNKTTRTTTIRATLDNRNDKFKPGMFVSGKLETATGPKEEDFITIPSSSVLWTGERSVVYVKSKTDEPIFEMREVSLGNRIGDVYEITDGLEPGEEVVTNGAFSVDAAAQLQGKKSMMNKSGGRTMTGHEGHQVMNTESRGSADSGSMKLNLPQLFQAQFQQILSVYFPMKDALVAGDEQQTADQASEALERLEKLDLSVLGETERDHVNNLALLLNESKEEEDINDQRSTFVRLNEHMVTLVSAIETFENTLYVQRCPMADNNRGAVWLSEEIEIRNPYFGDAMLKCGSVIDTLDN